VSSRPLAGQVALVSGASRGIGKGCALELAAAGAVVWTSARSAEGLERTLAEIRAEGGVGHAVPADHRDEDALEALVARVASESGRLDILVNSAFYVSRPMDPREPFWDTPRALWDDFLDVGPRSAYLLTHLAAPLMARQKRGLIANISSAGAVGYFHHVAYGVAKSALDRFTRDAARSLRKHGIAIVSVWPHVVLTETVRRMTAEQIDKSGAESQRFTGRAIAALAADPRMLSRTGRAWTSRQLAIEYGVTEDDGSLPRDASAVLGTVPGERGGA
jgi:NAD(P)-dependent dehydrogenase (short-subunit alcohol dehydrogenase family)